MNWLTKIVDEIEKRHPKGDLLIASGGSPSGTYHLGHLRELVTADAILLELKRRKRQAKHIYFSDDLDGLRKIPVNVPDSFEQYLGQPLCDVPSPDKTASSYGEYFLNSLINPSKTLGLEMEFINSHKKYREGFFVPAIELALEKADNVRKVLETVSGHKLGEEWSPIQVNEDGYLKKRRFIRIDKKAKTIYYEDRDGKEQSISYSNGDVKLDWRIDWPARWWLLGVDVEPFGRDHATKGGSYDTGVELARQVFGQEAPLPVPYDFVNMAGDNKKMSASKGTGLDAEGVVKILPPEIVRYFLLRFPPSKRLYFDPQNGVAELIDDFAALLAKQGKTEEDKKLIEICCHNIDPTVSSVPFTHLVASYQAALKDPVKTIENLNRSGGEKINEREQAIITKQLVFVDGWVKNWAPEDVRFDLAQKADKTQFNEKQAEFLSDLAGKIEKASENADGEWFHQAVYELKDSTGLEPKELFQTLYKVLIDKDAGPRAGWFLSILPRDWLIKRLRLEG
jgi:lysyl-tRNA synthetase class 1